MIAVLNVLILNSTILNERDDLYWGKKNKQKIRQDL